MNLTLACVHPPDVGRHRFLGERLERRVERHDLLVFLAEAADRDRALGRFLLADHEQDRDLGEGVLAHFVVDLLVAQVAFDAQPKLSCGFDHLARKAVGIRGDGGDDRLHRRQPERQVAGIVLDQNAGEALQRAEHGAVEHHRA